MRTLIQAIEQENNIIIKTRNDNNVSFENIPYLTHLFIRNEDMELISDKSYEWIKDIKADNIFDGYTALYLTNNKERGLLRWSLENDGIVVYEGDINAIKRYLISHQDIKINPKGLLWVMYDIETKDDGLFEFDMRGSAIASEPILTIAYKDYEGKRVFLRNDNLDDVFQGERELLIKHKAIMEQYDICSAWNGQKFDDTYIRQRCDVHNIQTTFLDFINKLDYMLVIRKNIVDLPSYALNDVSKELLGTGKLEDIEAGNGNIFRAWVNSFQGDNLLQEYNERDVDLMYQIEKKLNMIGLHMKESELGHCFIQDTLHNSDICDYLMLNICLTKGIISPSKPNTEESAERRKRKILGAEVFCDSPGVHDNVFVLDFKSWYPSTIAMCNICVTTLLSEKKDGCITIPRNYLERKGVPELADTKFFDGSKVGVISDVARWLITERDKVKYAKFEFIKTDPVKFREMQLYEKAIKTVANSLYGALAFVNFRWYNFDVASAVTQFAREIINRTRKYAEDVGYKVIQGDTDSIMFTGPDHKILQEKLKVKFDEWAEEMGIKNHIIVFEWEKTNHRMISVMKKNYAAIEELVDGDGKPTGQFKIKITGLECIKKDTNPLAKLIQKKLIEDILYDRLDTDELYNTVDEVRTALKTNTLNPDYLVMVKSLTKPISEYGKPMIDGKTGDIKLRKDGEIRYASIPAHVILAKNLISKGHEIFIGDNIKYIVKTTKPRIEAISVEEYNKGFEYDAPYYWDRIIKPVQKVLSVSNPDMILGTLGEF